MNTNIIITLDTRRKKKDGTYPVILRMSHRRKTISISLGISVNEKDWDSKRREIKKTYKGVNSVNRLNNLLSKKKSEAMEVVTKLEETNSLSFISIKQLKDKITNVNAPTSVFAFGEKKIKEMEQSQQFGNARTYKTVLSILRTHCKGADLRFEELNYEFLKKWEAKHLSKDNSLNSLSVYLRTVRALFNKAIKEGIIEQQAYPFKDYRIKSSPTKKRAISIKSLRKIVSLELTSDHELFHVRNLFVASYLLNGMNYIDMAFMQLSNINNGRIEYRRRKTAKLYDIKVTDQLQEVLNYYINDKESDDFIFPIIKRDQLADQYKDVEWARKRFNRGLKLLAKECGISDTLTSYVARHSFATQAMLNDVPLQAISAMLGHSKLSTTQVYLASLPSDVMDEYQERLKL